MFDKKQAASKYQQAIRNGMAINQQASEQIANIQSGYQNYQSMIALGASTLGKVSDGEEEQIAEAQEIARNSFMGNSNLETSQQRRRRDLQQRTSRIAERLSGVTAQRDSIHADDLKLKGVSDEEIQAAQTTQDRLRDTNQTSDLERAENAIRLYLGSDEEKQNAVYDRDIEYFVKNDAQIAEMHFGRDSAMYKAIQAIKQYNNRNLNSETSVNTSGNSVLNFSNLVSTAASGLSETVGGFSSLSHRATKDGKEREEAINNEDSWANQLQRFSDKIATAELNASKQRVSLIQSRAKEEGDRARELALKQGISKAQADKIARDVTSEINDGLYNVPMSISAEVAEFLPDLVTTALTMGATSVASASIKTGLNSVAKALGKGASKAEAKLAGEKAMKEFAKAELKAGRTITAEQAKQAQKEGIKAYFQSQRAQASKLDSKIVNTVGITEEAIETGSQNAIQGYQQASEAIKSMKIEDLKASKRGQEILKENPEISDEDLKLQLADEAGVLAYDMTFGGTAAMGILSGKVQTKAINAWKNLGSNKGGIGALGTSILQEFFGEGFEEGWTQFSSNFAESKLNQDKDLLEGIYDNAKYGAITGAASTSISNAPELIKLSSDETIKQVGNKIESFQEKSLNKKSDKELETIYGSSSDESVNEITGKKFSETSFGKTYNKLKESSDEIITKNIDPESYTSTIKNLQKEGQKLLKEIQNSKDEATSAKLENDFFKITDAIASFRDALDDDIASSSKSLYEDTKQFKELLKDPKNNEVKLQELQERIQSQMNESSVVKQIEDSSLFKMLNGIQDTKDTSKITLEQILGNPSFSTNNTEDARNNAEKSISESEDKNTSTIAKALRDYSINVSKSKTATNAEALDSTKKLFEHIKSSLKNNPNVSKTFVDSFNVLSKVLDSYDNSKALDLKAFRQVFFGGMEGNKYRFGLLDILSEIQDDGSISLKGLINLNKLYSHQLGKQKALKKAYTELQVNGQHEPIINDFDISGSAKEILSDSKNPLNFNHANWKIALKNYGQIVSRDVEAISAFANIINSYKPKQDNDNGSNNTYDIHWGKGNNKELSNLAPRSFKYNGIEYKSVEHAYQSLKSGKFDLHTYKQDWDKYKKISGKLGTDRSSNRDLMKDLIREFLNQNLNIKKMLLDTGSKTITHSDKDAYWSKEFPNILTELREEFKNIQNDPDKHFLDNLRKQAQEAGLDIVDFDINGKSYPYLAYGVKDGTRYIVKAKLPNGKTQLFYLSTGLGGKKDVEPNKWYAFFGIAPISQGSKSIGWIVKSGGKDSTPYSDGSYLPSMHNYGSSVLEDIQNKLNSIWDKNSLKEGLGNQFEYPYIKTGNDKDGNAQFKINPVFKELNETVGLDLSGNTSLGFNIANDSSETIPHIIHYLANNVWTKEELKQYAPSLYEQRYGENSNQENTNEFTNPLANVTTVAELSDHISTLGSNEFISEQEIKEKYQDLTNKSVEDTESWFQEELNKIIGKERNQALVDNVIKAWKSFESRWDKEKGSKYAAIVDTDENATILEDSKGNQVSIPLSAMVYLRDLGFDPRVNIVDEITTPSKEEIKPISDLIKEVDSSKEGNAFKKGLTSLSKFIQDFYDKHSNDLFNPKRKSPFTLINGFLNFIDETGKPNNEIKRALTLGLANVIGNSNSLSFRKNNEYTKYFQDRGAVDFIVENRTNAEKLGDGYNSSRDPVQLIESTNINEFNINQIGEDKLQFIHNLGKEIFKHSGLDWNKQSKEYSDNVRDGIINALGQQAYLLLLDSGMINVYQVRLQTTNGEESLHYVNFKTNDGSLSQSIEAIFNVASKQSPLENLSVEQAEAKLGKTKLGMQADLVLGTQSKQAQELFKEDNSKRAATIGSLKSLSETNVKDSDKVSKKDTSTEFGSRSSEVLDNAIDVHNKVTFAINMPLYNLLKANEEAFKTAMGYVSNVDSLNVTTDTKKAIQSKNRQIQRAIDLFKSYVNQAEQLGVPPNDMMLHFKHHFVSNNRIMLESDINPQSDKVIRELLRLVQKNISDDGTIIGELNLDITLGKAFDSRSNKSKRSIQRLIDHAFSKSQGKNKNFSMGFLLALAQGLDITKIEKKLTKNIFKDLEEALTPDSIYMQMADLVWKMNQAAEANEQYVLSQSENNLLKEFASKLGNGAPRAFNAIESLANYLYRGTDSDRFKDKPNRTKWTTSLLLESDGISNGMYNIIKQFNTRFTPEYLNSLKKTGVIPLDLLVQAYENNLHLENLEGSSDLFSENSNLGDSKLNDSYEDIAELLTVRLDNSLDFLMDYLSRVSVKDSNIMNILDNAIKNTEDENLKKHLGFIIQLEASGMLDLDGKSIIGDLLLSKVDDIQDEKFKAKVKRNLAKAGVTPTVYGGQLTGITNQLFSNFKDTLRTKADKVIELASKLDTQLNDSDRTNVVQSLNSLISKLRIISYALNNFDKVLVPSIDTKALSKGDYKDYFTKIMDDFLYNMKSSKKDLIDSIKEGLGKQLHESVQETFVESFALLNYAMAHDEVGFTDFIVEFKQKLETARELRNKKQKYSPNDPRQYDDLSKNEIKQVIKSITSAPVIATAFSENAELFEDILEKGNALIKTGSVGKVGQTTITSPFGLSKGNWVSYISSQIFSKYKEFMAAGASSATGTIPSTEAATQVGLAEELLDTLSGITSLDVFDGIDGLLFFRDLLGQIANKQTNKVHLETNLIKSFYDRFTRSGFDKFIETNNKVLFEGNLQSLDKFSNLFQLVGKKHKVKISSIEEVKFMLISATFAQMSLENMKTSPDFRDNPQDKEYVYSSIRFLNGFKAQLAQARDDLLTGKDVSEISLSTTQFDYLRQLDGYLPNNMSNMVDMYNNTLDDFAKKVAESTALKEIEKKYLPAIINQFGGANRGYFFNEDKLDTTGQMFKEFLNQKGLDIATYDFKNSSELLAEFLTTNPEIQEDYNKVKERTYKNLHKPFINVNKESTLDGSFNVTSSNSKDLDKILERTTPIKANLIKLFYRTIESIYGDAFIISSDIEKIADKIGLSGKDRQDFIERHENNTKNPMLGGYANTLGYPYIWVRESALTNFYGASSILLHEMQHLAMQTLYEFQANKDLFKLQKDMKQLDAKTFNRLNTISFRLDSLLKSISKNGSYLPNVQKRLKELNSNPSTYHHYKYGEGYSELEVSISNYLFLQQYSLDKLPEGWNQEDYRVALVGTKQEFVSYALDDDYLLNELAVRKENNHILNSIKKFFTRIKNEVLSFLGIDTLPDSQLTAMYEIIESFRQIAKSNKDFVDDATWFGNQNVNEASKYSENNTFFDSTSAGVMPSVVKSTNSNKHVSKLQKLINTFNQNVGNIKGISNYLQEQKLVQDSLTDTKADSILKGLRNLGVSVSYLEEEAFKLALAANLANFTSGNIDLQQQASSYIQQLIKDTDMNQVNKDLFDLVLNNKSVDSLAVAVALLTTNEQLANQFKLNDVSQSKLNEKLNQLVNYSDNISIFKDVPIDFKQDTKLNQIQIASMLFNFRSKPTAQANQEIQQKELDKLKLLKELSDKHQEIYNNLPKGIKHLFGLSADLLTGQDLLSDGSGADSSIGSLIRRILENHNKLHGRDTLLSQMAKWVIGQDFNRQYSAKFKGEVDQTSQAIRERIAAVIPLSLRNQFENLTQEDEQALDNVLNSSELNRIASISITGIKTSDILKDSKMRSQAVLDTIQNIKDDLGNYYAPKQVEQITNYLVWQSKGLGQQMVTGEVRTKSARENGQILPNAKVIASLRHIPKVANKTTEEQNLQVLETYVGQLASLYSLNHQNQDDLNVLADLFDNEPKGMDALVKSQDQLNQELNIQRQGNYLGQDGFVYNKKNPNQDVRLVDAKDLEQQRNLSQIGYKHKADLVTGEQVWVTNDSMTSRFTTGIFGLADTSIKGINQQSGKPIKGVYGKTQYNNTSTYFDNHPALNDHNYYDKLGSINSSNTQINAQGDIIGSYNGLPKSLENQFIQSFESGIDAIGNMKGRIMEEIATEQNNQHYINELNKVYNRSNNKNAFTLVDGNYKPKSNKPTDIEFANRLNNIYNSLPLATKEQIARQGGLYIETQEINNILGYSQSSVTDLWTGKSAMDPRLQKVIKSVFGLTGQLLGMEGNQVAKRFERGLSEVVSLGKDFVLNRSVVVPAWNMFSNVIHLWNRGIPYNKITPLVKEGTQNILKYNKDMNRLTELYHLRDISEGKDKLKYDAEINVLRKALDKNPVKPLVDEGILTSITLDNKSNEDKEFNYIPQLQRKFKFDKFKQTKVGKIWGNIAIQDGSWTHDTMEQILDLGDFVAKYAMYQHLTKDRGFNSDRAMNVIRDEFINYSYNRGRVFDYLSKMGLTWFLSYKLGIQKIVLRSLRRNFFRTSAIYAGAKASGINNIVPMQNLVFDGSLNYQTDATNIISAFGSHWFNMLKP